MTEDDIFEDNNGHGVYEVGVAESVPNSGKPSSLSHVGSLLLLKMTYVHTCPSTKNYVVRTAVIKHLVSLIILLYFSYLIIFINVNNGK